MSAHMKKRPTKQKNKFIRMQYAGKVYQFPVKVAEKYCLDEDAIDAEDLFSTINKAYTKPGALLRGIRIRENLTQIEMAQQLEVTQSDISQMENGVRSIGRKVAQRIEKLFGVDYRSFLE